MISVDKGKKRENNRPWGFYQVLGEEPGHKVKRITVHPGQRLSLQKHTRRWEHWIIVTGKALVTLDDAVIPLREGESIDVPCMSAHRVANPGSDPLVFIEVQRGTSLEEEDIIRLEDDYGRVETI